MATKAMKTMARGRNVSAKSAVISKAEQHRRDLEWIIATVGCDPEDAEGILAIESGKHNAGCCKAV
jgi:hypothetical protein